MRQNIGLWSDLRIMEAEIIYCRIREEGGRQICLVAREVSVVPSVWIKVRSSTDRSYVRYFSPETKDCHLFEEDVFSRTKNRLHYFLHVHTESGRSQYHLSAKIRMPNFVGQLSQTSYYQTNI